MSFKKVELNCFFTTTYHRHLCYKPDTRHCHDKSPHKKAILIEHTVCFETNFKKSAQIKENRYGSLLNDIQSTVFTCESITIEVGSRELVSVDNRSKLTTIYSHLNGSKNLVTELLNKLS